VTLMSVDQPILLILLNRLSQSFNVSSFVLDWFRSYLTDRSQFVVYDEKLSSTRLVKLVLLKTPV